MTCEHEQKRPPLPSFLPFPSITQSRNDVDSCVNAVRSLAKTRPSPLVVETEVTISRGVIRGHSTVASNQSSPPGMQRAVGYKRHCSFISPIPFNYAVQKRRRLVRERSEELSKNASVTCRGNTSSAISPRCNQGTFDSGATYRQYSTNHSGAPSILRYDHHHHHHHHRRRQ